MAKAQHMVCPEGRSSGYRIRAHSMEEAVSVYALTKAWPMEFLKAEHLGVKCPDALQAIATIGKHKFTFKVSDKGTKCVVKRVTPAVAPNPSVVPILQRDSVYGRENRWDGSEPLWTVAANRSRRHVGSQRLAKRVPR